MKRIILALGFSALSFPAWAACAVTNLQVKDNLGTTASVPYQDDGSGASNCEPLIGLIQGGNVAKIQAGNAAAAADKALTVADPNALAALTAPWPAGENHGGEIGSNQIRVQVAQTVSTSPAYSSGDAVGGLMTIAGAARVSGSLGASGTGGILQNIAVNSKSVQTAAMEIWVFDANPTGSTCTDNSAFVLATADFDKVIGVAAVPTTAANNSGWFSGGTGSVGQANNQAMAYDLSSATSLFACMVTRGTPTFTATTDISLKYNFLRN